MATEITIEAASGTEAEGIEFVLTLSEPAPAEVTVRFRTISGTALEGSDISPLDGTVTIPAGATTATLNVNPSTLTGGEIDENFTVEFFDPTNAVLAGGVDATRVTGVILEGDAVSLFVGDPVLVETDGATEARFEVRLSRPAAVDLTFSYTTADASAEAGEDYVATSGSLTIAAGQTLAEIVVPVIGDTVSEPGEQFSLVLTPDLASAPVIANGVADSAGVATILDDDTDPALPELSVASAENIEAGNLQFVLTLSEPAPAEVTVRFRTISGTALEGSDISPLDGTVTIPAGATTATLNVNPSTLTGGEIDENFTVEFFDPTNAVLAGGLPRLVANGTILEDFGVSLFVIPTFAFENSGEAVFDIHLSRALDSDITLNFSTANGTAVAGEDFVAQTGSVTFLAGQTEAAVRVPLLRDGLGEPDETFTLTLTTSTEIANGDDGATATGTIVEGGDQPLTTVSLSVSPVSAPEGGEATVVYTLSRTGSTANAVTATLLAGGAAMAGADHTGAVPASLTIPAGASEASFSLSVQDDDAVEPDETIVVTIAALDRDDHAIGTAVATHTILDDDVAPLPVLSIGDGPSLAEGDAGTPVFAFTVTRSGDLSGASSVDYVVTGSGISPAGIAKLLGSSRLRPRVRASGLQLGGIVAPKAEGVCSGVAPGGGGETVAARAEYDVDLVMG